MAKDKTDLLAQLLAKAEDEGATPEERETFLNAVSKMAARAGIELDMLRAKTAEEQGEKVNVPVSVTIDIGTKGDRGGGAYAALFLTLAKVYDVELILANSGAWVKAFGMSTDIQIVQKLYELLFPQMLADCIEFIEDGSWRSGGGSIWDARYAFYKGWRERVGERVRSARFVEMKRAQRKYKQEGQSTEIVMADKKREVSRLYWSEASRLKGWSAKSGSNRKARNAGTASGERARLSGASGAISS